MSDDRRPLVIVPEEHGKADDGLAKVFGYLAFAILVIGVIDHYITMALTTVLSGWNRLSSHWPF